MFRHFSIGLLAAMVTGVAAADEPTLRDGVLYFPEGLEVPAAMTPVEAEFIQVHPLGCWTICDLAASWVDSVRKRI